MALNRADITIAGRTLTLEASVGAADVYATEFLRGLAEPYRGLLEDDMLAAYGRNQPTVKVNAKVDGDGNPVTDGDGEYVIDKRAKERELPNPHYRGIDTPAILRFAWAMAVAAESCDDSWAEFERWSMHEVCLSITEQAQLYATVIYELGGGHIFRQPEGRGDADEPDGGLEG